MCRLHECVRELVGLDKSSPLEGDLLAVLAILGELLHHRLRGFGRIRTEHQVT